MSHYIKYPTWDDIELEMAKWKKIINACRTEREVEPYIEAMWHIFESMRSRMPDGWMYRQADRSGDKR